MVEMVEPSGSYALPLELSLLSRKERKRLLHLSQKKSAKKEINFLIWKKLILKFREREVLCLIIWLFEL